MTGRKILKPKLGPQLTLEQLENLRGLDYIEQYHFEKQDVSNLVLQQVEFSNCFFDHINFVHCVFEKVDFVNVIFDHCDLSNLDFSGRAVHRVLFQNCKLVGANFVESSLENVVFENCNLMYANFSDSRMCDILFDTCNLNEVNFHQVKWKHLRFWEDSFVRTEFFRTSLQGIDFTTCNIEGICLDPSCLRGLIVTSAQAISLSLLFGLIIDDESKEKD